MPDLNPIFYIATLIISVVIHEVAHGYAALSYGDHTAEYQGRLTLNPLKHLDMYGSIILPALLVLTHAPFMIGWAKPVPYNPDNFSPNKRRLGTLWVASAGILANLAIAILFGLIIRISTATSILPVEVLQLCSVVVLVNIVLALFNLVPIPPLDGSKILFSALGRKSFRFEIWFEKYSIIFILIFIFFLWGAISPLVSLIFRALTGLAV